MFSLQRAERGERCRRAVSREYGRARKGTAGFTLLEVQVAMLLLLVALMFAGGDDAYRGGRCSTVADL